jgi:hypothetical protein
LKIISLMDHERRKDFYSDIDLVSRQGNIFMPSRENCHALISKIKYYINLGS